MRQIKLILFSMILLIIILGVISQKNTIICELMTPSGYTEKVPNVLVSSSMSREKTKELLSLIESAKSRIKNTFGYIISSPKIIVAATENEALKLGSNIHGVTFLSPLGQCIVIGPKGQNIDVIAHEYIHAEVHHRIGWLNYLLNVPTWFNEGIATLVDFRKPYLLENIRLTRSEMNVIKNKTFHHSDIKHYQAARLLVNNINKSKLYENLEKLKQGENINSVFSIKN